MKATVYSRKQEIVNGLIHGAGIVFGVGCLPVLTGLAAAHNNVAGVVGPVSTVFVSFYCSPVLLCIIFPRIRL